MTWQAIAALDSPQIILLLPRGPYLYWESFRQGRSGSYLPYATSSPFAGVGRRIPPQSDFTIQFIDAMII